MTLLPGIFSLIVMAAGWYYIFYSPAAHRLSQIEGDRINTLRKRLRRSNGVVMMLLAVAFYAACYSAPESARATWIFIGIVLLLAAMLVLALIDLQLTRRLKAKQKRDQS